MKIKNGHFLATIAATGLLVTTSGTATPLYKLNTATHTTSVSGVDLKNYDTFGGTKDFKAIHRITNWESADRPCKMKVKMRHLNKYDGTTDSHSLISGSCNGDKITVGYNDTETYIRGVQVCTNLSRIKGLRVWGSKLDRSTGALSNVARDQDTRTNCGMWGKKYYCPAGQIATQIKVSVNAPDYTGIALACRQLVAK